MSAPHITVSYNGGEKRVPLSVQPSLELTDSQVDRAEGELHRVLRKLFNVDPEVAFYLHEVETKRVMSKESFREPSYCQSFPTHWYLVMDSYSATSANGSTAGSYQYTMSHSMDEDLSRLGEDLSSLDLEDSGLPALANLSDTKYQSFTLNGLGDTGCSLRYFSIQPSSSMRSTTPMEHSHSRTDSRSDSYISSDSADSLGALRLSTTYIACVREDSMAARAGLEVGFVVHMINGDSILRCNVEQIRTITEHCGAEATLLGLPKDSDDLQFLYSKYTAGPTGQFPTEEGFITVVDLPLVLGPHHTSQSGVPGPSSNGLSPPSGMIPFEDNSQENSLSCDPYPLTGGHTSKHSADDILILGSLSEIGTHEGKWEEPAPPTSGLLGDSTGAGLSNGKTDSPKMPQAIEKEWYQQSEEEILFATAEGPEARTEDTASQTSEEKKHTMKKERKSLEALTRIPLSDQTLEQADTGNANFNSSLGTAKHWTSQSSHGFPSSENSQLSGGSGSGRGQVVGQLSGHSEEEQMSGESGGSGKHDASMTHSTSGSSFPSHTSTAPQSGGGVGGGAGGRRAVRGYQFRRNQLHKAKSKSAMSDQDTSDTLHQSWTESESGGGPLTESESAPPPPVPPTSITVTMEAPPPVLGADGYSPISPLHSGLKVNSIPEPSHSGKVNNSLPIVRHRSVKETFTTPLQQPEKRTRPLSAYEPHSTNAAVPPSNNQPHLNFRSTDSPVGAPLFTTTTALTPGGEEVFREVNIEEAIARSQGNILSCQEHSPEDHPRARRHKSSDAVAILSANQSSVLNSSMPSSSNRMEIICHGLLSIKQEGGKKQDKAWRSYYAVLAGTRLSFYKDKKEAMWEKPCEEPPIEVIPAIVDMEAKGTKRKHVFRLLTSQGQTYLLQADDAPSKQRWMLYIRQLNAKHQTTGVPAKMAPQSPQSLRRMSSPQPTKPSGGGAGGSGTSFLGRLKRTLKRQQQDNDGMDYSSFAAFGQPLKDCPVSPDNKRVPLVVEFCVNEVEEHGLTVEGIYRKPGLLAMINNISAQMDKGNYDFDISDYGQDIHTVGSLLKKYFKELPDPLIPIAMHDNFLACARQANQEVRLTTLKELVFQLPTAHYHTLSFLMRHLTNVVTHSSENKMTLRNVALVFAPTLMRSSADGEELLANMTAGYTTVELLCQHVEFLFEEDLCAEELSASKEKPVPETEDMVSRDSPPQANTTMETMAQKEQALATASPLSVRRIQNKLVRESDAHKRYSAAHAESLGSIPKLVNQLGGSVTLPHPSYLHASDSNINSNSPVPAEAEGTRKKPTRHMYEDVELAPKEEGPPEGSKSDARTMNWVNHHQELNWGRGEDGPGREMTGSMWSSRNRMQRQHSRERLRNGNGGRRLGKTKSDQGREMVPSYQGPPPGSRPYRQQSLQSAVPQPHPQPVSKPLEDREPPAPLRDRAVAQHSHAHARQQFKSRRISYMQAMNDPSELPVRENPGSQLRPTREEGPHHTHRMSRDEQFSSPEYTYAPSNRHGNSRHLDSYAQETSRMYQPHQPRPLSSHGMQQRMDSYGRDLGPPISHRRRSSESSEPPLDRVGRGAQFYHPGRTHLQGIHPRRTFSNERTYSNDSPPQREHASGPVYPDHTHRSTPTHQHRSAQVESYL